MGQTSSFFNAVETSPGVYDRSYNATQWAQYFASFIGNGIFANPSSNLQVNAGSGMQVLVNTGSAFINGYYYNNDSVLPINITAANGTYPRITNVVVELSLTNRNITIQTVDGIPSPNPTAPTLTRTTGVYQLCLAQITVPAGSASIVQGNISDTRLLNDLCGVVASTVQHLDTSTLYQQWEDGFTTWFNNIKNTFDTSQAGSITTQLAALTKQVNNFPNVYLSLNSTPSLSNTWEFSTVQINENGYFEFLNSSGNEIINFNVDTDSFYLNNNNSGINLMEITPTSTSGATDTITWNAEFQLNEAVTAEIVTISNNLTVNEQVNYSTGYTANYNCTNMISLQNFYNTNGWALQNTSTNNNIINIIPSDNAGEDNVEVNGELTISGTSTAATVNVTNSNGGLQVNGNSLFNGILYQTGTIMLGGNEVQYVATGWWINTSVLTCTNSTTCGFFGCLGVNLTCNNTTYQAGDFTINLSGDPLGTASLNTAMGINVPFIQTQATTTPFYISKITSNSITIDTLNGDSEYLYETYVRTLITN